jgi:hypothetical protein
MRPSAALKRVARQMPESAYEAERDVNENGGEYGAPSPARYSCGKPHKKRATGSHQAAL